MTETVFKDFVLQCNTVRWHVHCQKLLHLKLEYIKATYKLAVIIVHFLYRILK